MPWPNHILTRTLVGTYKNATNDPAKGRVTFTPTATILDDSNAVIVSDTITAPLDANGSFSIELPTTDNQLLKPKNWAYVVSVRIYGVKPIKYYILMPYGDGSVIDIIDIPTTTLTAVQDSTIQSSVIRGPIGPPGSGIVVGEGFPSNSIGGNGSVYIDRLTGIFYGPKENGVWPVEPILSSTATARYVHTQASPSDTWNIIHSLGGKPSVTVVDSNDTIVIGEVTYNSDTSITISFTAPFSGYAYLT